MATKDTYIGCRIGNITITKGNEIKNLILYPPAKSSLPIENYQPRLHRYQEENLCSPLALDEALEFKNQTEDDIINGFINKPSTMGNRMCQMLKSILDNEA